MTLGVVLALVFALGWVPLYVFRVESVGRVLPTYDRTERRWVRLSVAILTAHNSAACMAVSTAPAIPLWFAVLGLVAFAAGVGFWFWGRALIGPLRVRRLPNEAPTRLRREGPFRLVRNPLYLGVLVAAGAPVVVARRGFLGLSLALCAVALAVRAVQEERRLRAQLGAPYDAYSRHVKRLVPFVW